MSAVATEALTAEAMIKIAREQLDAFNNGDWERLQAGLAADARYHEFASQRKVEGPPLEPGERCLIVEDVVTTGGSTVQAIEAVRAEGHDVVGVVTVLDRLAGGAEAIARASGNAPYQALATIDDVYPDRPDRRDEPS